MYLYIITSVRISIYTHNNIHRLYPPKSQMSHVGHTPHIGNYIIEFHMEHTLFKMADEFIMYSSEQGCDPAFIS